MRWFLTGVWLYAVASVRLVGLEPAQAPVFGSDVEMLEAIQRGAFAYFRDEANPANGLVRDRSTPDSKCSIAAVGFGLSAWCIGVERGYVTRAEAAVRVERTLRTFLDAPQGPQASGTSGYRGWYYHFLEMQTGLRAWKCELSSIDTALFLAGALDASVFFDRKDPLEREIRRSAAALLERVDWGFMCNGSDVLSMGWHPETGFISRHWVGYNEAMILYILALGSGKGGLSSKAWDGWTRGYIWSEHAGLGFVDFAPLFGHQYSHCWIDFRGRPDGWMRPHGIDYFENSRRAVLAQRAYCMTNALGHAEYGSWMWGISACDGPGGYAAHGAPPAENDDGTLAPTAMVSSLPFAPDICLRSMRELHRIWGSRLWTKYGYRDGFNPGKGWVASDVLGIDQGPMLLMIANYQTGSVWRRMMGHPVVWRGMAKAGFRRW